MEEDKENFKDIPLVSINCCCYNQADYITQTLEGFIIQKTTFKFEVIVHDDASTDGTAEIVRQFSKKYPEIIKPILETENQWSKHDGSLTRIMQKRMTGKYIAFCEGDDYWLDPYKLQKQVDFLEVNPDYGLCYTKGKIYNQTKSRFEGMAGFPFKDFESLLYIGNPIPTLTVVCRNDLEKQYHKEINPSTKDWMMGDFPRWIWFAKNSKIKYLKDVTAVYRVLPNSASHSVDVNKMVAFMKSTWDIQNYFVQKYNMTPLKSFDEHRSLSQIYVTNGDRKNALKEFKQVECSSRKDTVKLLIYSNPLLFKLYKLYLKGKLYFN